MGLWVCGFYRLSRVYVQGWQGLRCLQGLWVSVLKGSGAVTRSLSCYDDGEDVIQEFSKGTGIHSLTCPQAPVGHDS